MESLRHTFKLKVKILWARAHKRKKKNFVTFILSDGNFFNICVLSQGIVYWINFQKIHDFAYQKTLLHTLLLLVFKIVESLRYKFNFKHNPHINLIVFLLTLSKMVPDTSQS